MSWSYQKLFKVNFQHNYYADGKCGDFTVVPTADCARLMQNYQLLIRTTNDGFTVLCQAKQEGNDWKVARTLDPNFRLSFFLINNNLYFSNFTDLPFVVESKVYCFSNLVHNVQNQQQLLHANTEVSEAEAVTIKPQVFAYDISALTAPVAIKITNTKGEVVVKETVEDLEAGYKVDLSLEPESRYQLDANGEIFDFYTYNFATMKSIWGAIEIYNDPSASNADKMVDDNDVLAPQDYKLVFKTRNTIWKYFLLNKSNHTFNDLAITNGKKVAEFDGPEEAELSTGDTVKVFQSMEELPLKQVPEQVFQLKRNYDPSTKTGTTVVEHLPTPSVQVVKPTVVNNVENVYSEIFVYL